MKNKNIIYLAIVALVVLILLAMFGGGNIFVSREIASDSTRHGTLSLSWSQNTEEDLGGYKIYYGTSPRGDKECPPGGYEHSLDVGNVTSYTLTGLVENTTYYLSLSSYDTSGNESECTEEIPKIANISIPQ